MEAIKALNTMGKRATHTNVSSVTDLGFRDAKTVGKRRPGALSATISWSDDSLSQLVINMTG